MGKKMMKRGVCLLLAVLLLWVAVPVAAVEPLGFRTAPMVVSGGGHTLALRNDGTVWAWGTNESGQLGDGTNVTRINPVQVRSLTNVIAIGADWSRSMALRSDGTVWAWGHNWAGWLGDGTTIDRATPVQVRNLTDVTAIAVGRHTLALRNDGTVWAWGTNYTGELGDGTRTERAIPEQVQGIDNVTAISAGEHSVALRDDGTVWTWGEVDRENFFFHTPRSVVPAQIHGLTDVTSIAAGRSHTLALRNDGTVRAWGKNWEGQLGDGTQTARITPVQVQNLANVTAITAGSYHNLATRSDGTTWAWGSNSGGALGNEFADWLTLPVQVYNLNHVISLEAGPDHSVALRNDGTVWVWGLDFSLADGGDVPFNTTPIQVRGPGGSGFLNLGTAPIPGRTHFNDVWLDDWFHDAVEFAYTQNIMQGTSAMAFSPRANFSRAQVVATLYRMVHGGTAREVPYAQNRPVFHDVETDAWYSPYIIWAYDNDIVAGIGGDRFGPGRNVTREQFAAMLYRFAGFMGHDTVVWRGPQWGSFTDLYQISTWAGAEDALTWANSHGFITGRTNTTLVPGGTAQRAEAATILMRFMQWFDGE